MAEDSTNDIAWFLRTSREHKDLLSSIRPWQNLKVAFEGHDIWVTGFSFAQIESLEVKSNPYAEIFYVKGPKLFPQNSQLPARNIPALLWTPILRAFPIRLPDFNHNYFGIEEKIAVRLIPSDQESDPVAMLVSLDVLGEYLLTAPAVRLEKQSWIVVENEQALLIGKPLLPIQGEVFWQRKDLLLPAGYDIEFPVLASSINQRLNKASDCWILWQRESQYIRIPKADMKKLSLGSFRLTQNRLTKLRT